MKSISVRLPDEQVERLDQDGRGRSAALRDLLEQPAALTYTASEPVTTDEELNELAGMRLIPANLTPESDAMGRLETFIAAGQAGLKLDDLFPDSEPVPAFRLGDQILGAVRTQERERQERVNTLLAMDEYRSSGGYNDPIAIDPTIRAMMQLSEYYCIVEGDLWQTILVPLEVGFQDYDFPTGDKGARREARQFMESIDAHRVIEEMWLARQTYGNTYPLQVRDQTAKKRDLTSIVVPNSKHIAVGRPSGLSEGSLFAYQPSTPATALALLKAEPSFLLGGPSSDWNEQQVAAYGVPLDPQYVTHLHVPKFAQNFYAVPPLARATRSIDSRRFLEEMARATIEGIKNQLWVFKLENPRPGEAALLAQVLAGARGARTGFLVWSSNLAIEQFVPGSIDELLAPEATWNYTMKVYRDLGISIRLISGEAPTSSAKSDSTVDVDVALDRLMYSRAPFVRYFQPLIDEAIGADSNGTSRAKLRLADVSLKVAETIRTRLVPLMNYGIPSPTTAFTMAGLDPDAEQAQHERDMPFRQKYIMPYSGFAQNGPSGRAEQGEPGRPVGKAEMQPRAAKNGNSAQAQVVQAADDGVETGLADDPVYDGALYALWLGYLQDWQASLEREALTDAFIEGMRSLGEHYRPLAYVQGYHEAGGTGMPDPARIDRWVIWDYDNLENLRETLLALASFADLTGLERRVLLYAEMGHRMAYVAGLLQAKAEEGAKGWRRILRPHASRSGPCPVCVADSRVIHPITEDFFDHVNGVCGMVYLAFYYSEYATGQVVRIPASEPETGEAHD